jgi:hypothetical protein
MTGRRQNWCAVTNRACVVSSVCALPIRDYGGPSILWMSVNPSGAIPATSCSWRISADHCRSHHRGTEALLCRLSRACCDGSRGRAWSGDHGHQDGTAFDQSSNTSAEQNCVIPRTDNRLPRVRAPLAREPGRAERERPRPELPRAAARGCLLRQARQGFSGQGRAVTGGVPEMPPGPSVGGRPLRLR